MNSRRRMLPQAEEGYGTKLNRYIEAAWAGRRPNRVNFRPLWYYTGNFRFW